MPFTNFTRVHHKTSVCGVYLAQAKQGLSHNLRAADARAMFCLDVTLELRWGVVHLELSVSFASAARLG